MKSLVFGIEDEFVLEANGAEIESEAELTRIKELTRI
jgi:hypothetical protein